MRRKLKVTLITLIVVALIIAITLILLSLGRIDIGYVGLSYDTILSNYSSTEVYGPGLHFIGLARQFIRIRQIPTFININVTTYTTDYYKLNAKIIATYQFTDPNNFNSVSKFYINFGHDAQNIIKSVIEMEIVQTLSKFSSTQYKGNEFTQSLQTTLMEKIDVILTEDLQVELDITILIQSLVIQGVTTSNLEAINRQIQHVMRQLSRAQNQKIQLSKFIENYKLKTQQQIRIAEQIIKQKTDIVLSLLQAYGNSSSMISTILFGNQVMKDNLAFASSQLLLRPELYTINGSSTVVY